MMIEKSLLRPLFVVSVAVWFGLLAIYAVIPMFEGVLPADIVQRSATYAFSAMLSFLAGILAFMAISARLPMRWPLVALIAAVTLVIHAIVGVAIFKAFPPYEYLVTAEFLPLFRNGIIYDAPIVCSVFIGFVAIHFGRELAEQQRLSLARESAARDAQLAALRHQLSPHFLFNTLNSISALISENDRDGAERTVLMLGDFLRYSLDAEASELVTLEEELASVHAYLAIEFVRFEDRLQIREQIDDAAKPALVPPFLLQPIFENVIKHAVAKLSRPVTVSLQCALDGGDLEIVVEDDGPGMAGQSIRSTGTGLRNLRQRLRLLYGGKASVTTSEAEPTGFRVSVRLKAPGLKDA